VKRGKAHTNFRHHYKQFTGRIFKTGSPEHITDTEEQNRIVRKATRRLKKATEDTVVSNFRTTLPAKGDTTWTAWLQALWGGNEWGIRFTWDFTPCCWASGYRRFEVTLCRGQQIFQKSRRHLKILGAKSKIWSKFQNQDPKMLRTAVQNVATWRNWWPAYVHPWRRTTAFIFTGLAMEEWTLIW
jgi:hypothetical protein